MAHYLENQGVWSKQQEAEMQAEIKAEVEKQTDVYLKREPQEKNSLFTYLYKNMPEVLFDQIDELGEQT